MKVSIKNPGHLSLTPFLRDYVPARTRMFITFLAERLLFKALQ